MRVFDSGATRDNDETKLDFEGFLSPEVLEGYARYMHEHRKQADGQMRDSDNWQKGIPREQYMKSMWRHFFDAWKLWREEKRRIAAGLTTESTHDDITLSLKRRENLHALLFNVMGALYELEQGR